MQALAIIRSGNRTVAAGFLPSRGSLDLLVGTQKLNACMLSIVLGAFKAFLDTRANVVVRAGVVHIPNDTRKDFRRRESGLNHVRYLLQRVGKTFRGPGFSPQL